MYAFTYHKPTSARQAATLLAKKEDAKLIAGEEVPHNIVVKPVLITQKDLRDNGIKTVEDLNAKLPAFGQSDAATAPWIPAAK